LRASQRERRVEGDEQFTPPFAIKGSDFGDLVRKSAYFIEAVE